MILKVDPVIVSGTILTDDGKTQLMRKLKTAMNKYPVKETTCAVGIDGLVVYTVFYYVETKR